MRGHERIRRQRLAGWAPALVRVETDGGPLPLSWHDSPPGDPVPEIRIDPADALRRLDLRFLTGLVVAVTGCEAGRVAAVAGACEAAGAVRVIATTLERDDSTGEAHFDAVRVTDTEGALAWPS